ncbi:MAG: helix-turn-helix domain-containing protein [Acidimicrobiales bacterium]
MAGIAEESAADDLPPLRSQAVARSLDGARARAEERQRFLDATTELILDKGGLDFTVQDVVERSSQSLRSFYQFFDGKQHLLLAVYEDAIRGAAGELAKVLDPIDDPLERLRTAIVTIYEWSEQGPQPATPSPHLTVRAMASFVFELMTTDRDAIASATQPLFALVYDALCAPVEAGAVTADNPRRSGPSSCRPPCSTRSARPPPAARPTVTPGGGPVATATTRLVGLTRSAAACRTDRIVVLPVIHPAVAAQERGAAPGEPPAVDGAVEHVVVPGKAHVVGALIDEQVVLRPGRGVAVDVDQGRVHDELAAWCGVEEGRELRHRVVGAERVVDPVGDEQVDQGGHLVAAEVLGVPRGEVLQGQLILDGDGHRCSSGRGRTAWTTVLGAARRP